MLAYRITDDAVTVFINGVPTTIVKGHRFFDKVCMLIRHGAPEDSIIDAIEASKATVRYTAGIPDLVWGIENQTATYKGEALPQSLIERMKTCLSASTPIGYLEAFIQRLWANPSRKSREQLFQFLEHKNLPITARGTFLGYKSVRPDMTDHHTGKFSNQIGNILVMPRRDVDDDSNQGCSAGWHVGSLSYATTFGGEDRIVVVVEVDPADVVSVPTDCNFQKLRTCKYTVVAKYEGPLPESHVDDSSAPYNDTDELEYDNEFEIEEAQEAVADAQRLVEEARSDSEQATMRTQQALLALEAAQGSLDNLT